jgi:hypothetical protein
LKTSVSLQVALEREEAYFNDHEIWKKIEPSSRGIHSLCNRLTSIIVNRAMERAPFIKWLLRDKTRKIEEKLHSLGTELPSDDKERSKILIRVLSKFTQVLRKIGVGEYRDELVQNDAEMRIKFHINELMKSLAYNLSLNRPDFESDKYAEKLSKGMLEMRGRYLFLLLFIILSTIKNFLIIYFTVLQIFLQLFLFF